MDVGLFEFAVSRRPEASSLPTGWRPSRHRLDSAHIPRCPAVRPNHLDCGRWRARAHAQPSRAPRRPPDTLAQSRRRRRSDRSSLGELETAVKLARSGGPARRRSAPALIQTSRLQMSARSSWRPARASGRTGLTAGFDVAEVLPGALAANRACGLRRAFRVTSSSAAVSPACGGGSAPCALRG